MEISLDESGSFVSINAQEGSWSTIAAYVSPETEKRKYKTIIDELKLSEGKNKRDEIKLHEVSESNYFKFLGNLSSIKGSLICIATDSHFNNEATVKLHRKNQVHSIAENIDRMYYESGKDALRYLIDQLENIPVQLYIQLTCQIMLMYSFIERGITYYVQRTPNSLKTFRWRIDHKEPTKKTDYEDAFEKFSPALLQSLSITKPTPALKWCNYKPMKEFMSGKGGLPDYLKQELPELNEAEGFDLQKIIRGDIEFVDSKSSIGVQIADLLASGLRRCLKFGFHDNETAAKLLGSLMIQAINDEYPIEIVTFGDADILDKKTAKLINIMIRSCKPMLK